MLGRERDVGVWGRISGAGLVWGVGCGVWGLHNIRTEGMVMVEEAWDVGAE